MKRAVTTILIISLLAPSVAFAREFDEVTPPTSAPRLGSGSTMDVLSGTGSNAASRIAALSSAGDVIGCETGGRGGALGGQFSQFLRNLVPNLIRNTLGRAASQLASRAGPLGGIILQGADALSNILSKEVLSLAQPLLDGPIGQALNGILSGPLGGIAGQLLNGGGVQQALSSVLGGFAGFGAAIPVNTVSINELIALIRRFTEGTMDATQLHVQKKCVGDIATRQAGKAQAAEIVRGYLKNSQEHLIQNLGVHIKGGRFEVAKNVIENYSGGLCGKYSDDVKNLVLTQFTTGSKVDSQATCDIPQSGGPETSDVSAMWHAGTHSNGSAIGQFINFDDLLYQAMNEYTEFEKLSIQANGQFVGEIECLDSSEVPKFGRCNSGHRVTTPGSVSQYLTNKAVDHGREEAANADEVGELPTQLMAALSSMILQSLSGISGVLENSGSSSEGSYLDQAVAEASYGSDTALQGALGSDIHAALETEVAYRDTTRLALQTLTTIRTSYRSAIDCLRPKATQGNATALTNMQRASTTVAAILTPEINSLTELEKDSLEAITLLTELVSRLEGAATVDDTIAVHTEYQSLLDAGVIHTTDDLSQLTTNLEAALSTLNLLATEAAVYLAECQTL
jgi:hypothetical protein